MESLTRGFLRDLFSLGWLARAWWTMTRWMYRHPDLVKAGLTILVLDILAAIPEPGGRWLEELVAATRATIGSNPLAIICLVPLVMPICFGGPLVFGFYLWTKAHNAQFPELPDRRTLAAILFALTPLLWPLLLFPMAIVASGAVIVLTFCAVVFLCYALWLLVVSAGYLTIVALCWPYMVFDKLAKSLALPTLAAIGTVLSVLGLVLQSLYA
jgi:hypothetical protein